MAGAGQPTRSWDLAAAPCCPVQKKLLRGLFCDCEPWRARRPSPPPCRCWRASLPVEPARPERAPGAPSGDVHLVLLSSAQPDLSSAGAAHKNLLLTMTTQDEQDDRPRRWRRCRRVPGERCTARAPHTHLARATHTHARTTCTPHALGPGMRRLRHDLPGRPGPSGRGGGMATRSARDGFWQPRAAPAP